MSTDCGACLYTDDGDIPDFYDSRDVRARKAHKCTECGCTIAVDERYERTSGKWGGDVRTYVTCAECADIATALSCDGGRLHGGLWEALNDLGPDVVGPGCLAKIATAAAKAKLQEWWIKQKGLA
jgi:hypothetical protein